MLNTLNLENAVVKFGNAPDKLFELRSRNSGVASHFPTTDTSPEKVFLLRSITKQLLKLDGSSPDKPLEERFNRVKVVELISLIDPALE